MSLWVLRWVRKADPCWDGSITMSCVGMVCAINCVVLVQYSKPSPAETHSAERFSRLESSRETFCHAKRLQGHVTICAYPPPPPPPCRHPRLIFQIVPNLEMPPAPVHKEKEKKTVFVTRVRARACVCVCLFILHSKQRQTDKALFSFQAVTVWNNLPQTARHSTSISSFKYSLETLLVSK